MNDELQAAAGRLLEPRGYQGTHSEETRDFITVATEMLPLLDPTPIDIKWLKAIIGCPKSVLTETGSVVSIFFLDNACQVFVSSSQAAIAKTRGELRGLLRYLKVKTKEGA